MKSTFTRSPGTVPSGKNWFTSHNAVHALPTGTVHEPTVDEHDRDGRGCRSTHNGLLSVPLTASRLGRSNRRGRVRIVAEWRVPRSSGLCASPARVLRRFERPAPPDRRAARLICARFASSRHGRSGMSTPAHASKSARANQLRAWLSTPRTAAFVIGALDARSARVERWIWELAGTISGTIWPSTACA
jgi:hypothetical protein